MENDPSLSGFQVIHEEAANRFTIELGPTRAVLEYELQDGKMIITHTGVPTAWEGQGIASRLAHAALDHARQQGLKVVPLCSFISMFIQRHQEYKDLLD